MNISIIILSLLAGFSAAHADQGVAPYIFTGSAKSSDRAIACQRALNSAEASATNLPMLQMQGKIEKIEKKCDCREETEENFATKRITKNWSCLGIIAFTAKK